MNLLSVEKEDANVLSTEVNVKYTGTYHYKVFEQASDTNLIIENTTQLVAQGILWVTDEGEITTDVFFNLTEQNIIFNE